MTTPALFFTIFSIIACFVALAAQGAISLELAELFMAFFVVVAGLAWLCKISFLKTLIGAAMAVLAIVSLAVKAGNWNAFSDVLANLIAIGLMCFAMVMMVFGPFR